MKKISLTEKVLPHLAITRHGSAYIQNGSLTDVGERHAYNLGKEIESFLDTTSYSKILFVVSDQRRSIETAHLASQVIIRKNTKNLVVEIMKNNRLNGTIDLEFLRSLSPSEEKFVCCISHKPTISPYFTGGYAMNVPHCKLFGLDFCMEAGIKE